MPAALTGLGRINSAGFQTLRRGRRTETLDIKAIFTFLKEEAVFFQPVKYFSKFDTVSQMALCVCGLALWDAGQSGRKKSGWGIVGTNREGCLTANLDYFQDYVTNGRQKARGKLFVYTLPSTPLAETAIAFGCQGPQLYIQPARPGLSRLLTCAQQTMEDSGCAGMLAVHAENRTGLALTLELETNRQILSFDDVLREYDTY